MRQPFSKLWFIIWHIIEKFEIIFYQDCVIKLLYILTTFRFALILRKRVDYFIVDRCNYFLHYFPCFCSLPLSLMVNFIHPFFHSLWFTAVFLNLRPINYKLHLIVYFVHPLFYSIWFTAVFLNLRPINFKLHLIVYFVHPRFHFLRFQTLYLNLPLILELTVKSNQFK